MAEHRTVSRVVGILEVVARARRPVPLSVLAAQLDAPKSSLHGLVGGLLHRGYLSEIDGGYRLGAGAHALLAPAGSSLPLLLGESCAEIAVRTGETVTLATRVGDRSVVYVHSEPSAFEVCYRPRLRERRPILPTSAGKLFLAHDDDRDSVLARADEDHRRRFLTEIDSIRASGMAFNRGETVSDLGAVAVGVYEDDRLTAGITIAGPLTRVAERLEYFGGLAQEVLTADGFSRHGRQPS
ncbi:IclR family transcriptional regulator [Brevibacterium yomogidense]|uniref:IclR family transcriptional regulator n=1 Tax=Brevibacterium yomogidense TaxID=946573 RepID=UPI0015C5920A|nr:IclR family transcriptional regulator C-terminal domain-containing protein [Brevibacterium yomogidense]